MSMSLVQKKCKHCEKDGVKKLTPKQIGEYCAQIPAWKLTGDGKSISQLIMFKDFVKAMSFVGVVADIAEEEGHHPDIVINYNKVSLTMTTHSVGGLTESDFIVAAKIDDRAVLAQLL
jgi:4a-hydroxytetrahydrobiopterin dehydratase